MFDFFLKVHLFDTHAYCVREEQQSKACLCGIEAMLLTFDVDLLHTFLDLVFCFNFWSYKEAFRYFVIIKRPTVMIH